jgi:hypothetical protein
MDKEAKPDLAYFSTSMQYIGADRDFADRQFAPETTLLPSVIGVKMNHEPAEHRRWQYTQKQVEKIV